jgi:hypothetical protein
MYSDPSSEGKKIRDYWRRHGKLNNENGKKIKKAMKDSGLGVMSIPMFLYNEKHQKKHAAVARLLNL